MSLRVYLLAAVVIAGLCRGSKSESLISGFNQIIECAKQEPWALNCVDQVCTAKKCLKLAYHLMFENSSYSLNKNHEVARVAHCGIDKCFQGVMEHMEVEELFSEWKIFVVCLRSMSSCVKNDPKDEL